MKLKNLFPALLMAFPLALTQCNKEEPQNPEKPTPDTPIEKVTLRIENPGTKTTLAGDRQVLWTEGDVVTINGTSYPIEIDAEDSSVATVKDVEKSDAYVGTYLDGGVRTEGQASVSFKSSLTYASGTFSTNENPMIAYSTSETLRFHNAGGILKAGFTSADNVSIKSITLKSNADEVLAGTYVYNVSDLASNNFNNGTFAENATATSIAVNIAEAVALSTEAQYFYFILPADTYATGLTIDVTDIDGNVTSFTSTGSITINRAEIAEIGSAIEIEAGEAPEPEPTASIWGIVGVVNEWGASSDIPMYVTDTENLFVAYDVVLPEGDFKIRGNNSWADDTLNYGFEYTGTVLPDHYYSVICGGGSQNITIAAGTYDIWFDLNNSKIYVMTPGNDIANAENGQEEPAEVYYDLLGSIVGNYWKDPVIMTLEDSLYVAKGIEFDWGANIMPDDPTTKPYSQFKIRRNGNWAYEIGSPYIENDLIISDINSELQLVSKETSSYTQDVCFVQTGIFDIYFDAATLKVWVMTPGYKPGETGPLSWGLMGDFLDNSWQTDIALTEDSEWLSAKNVTFNTLCFKIRANGTWEYNEGNLGLPLESYPKELNTAIQLIAASDEVADDIRLNGAPGTYDVYFNPSAKEVWVMTCGYRPGDEIPVPDTTISAGATIEEFTKTTIEW